jgi:hypothetical protein
MVRHRRREEDALMVTVKLTPDEADTLAEVLESCVSDLRMEIADTDSMDFRENLKRRRETLEAIVERLKDSQTTSRLISKKENSSR